MGLDRFHQRGLAVVLAFVLGLAPLGAAQAAPAVAPAAVPPSAVAWDMGPPVLVAGGPGTGRSTRARAMAHEPVSVLSAAGALLDGTQGWARDFASMVRAGQGTVCVDGLELLPEELLDLVRRTLDGDVQAIRETFPRVRAACAAYDVRRSHTLTGDMVDGWGDQLALLRVS